MKRKSIENEIQLERELRSKQNNELREKGVIAAVSRRQKLLEEQKEKNRVALEAHSKRLAFILETIAVQEEMKKLKSENKWKMIEERIKELKSRRKLRTNMHMGNTCYHRQYVVDDYSVPLNPELVEVDEGFGEQMYLCSEQVPEILTTPKN